MIPLKMEKFLIPSSHCSGPIVHWVKAKWRFFSSFILNQFSKLWRFIFLTVSPGDKPSFYSLTKPTFKLCFLCGVVKTCLPWNFIAFLNLKCWWECEKGENIGNNFKEIWNVSKQNFPAETNIGKYSQQILTSILKKYALYQTKIWDKYWQVFSTNITSILMKYAMYENKILTKGEYFLEKLVVFICLRDKLYNVNTF